MNTYESLESQVDVALESVEVPILMICRALLHKILSNNPLDSHEAFEECRRSHNRSHPELPPILPAHAKTVGRELGRGFSDSYLKDRNTLITDTVMTKQLLHFTLQSLTTVGKELPLDIILQGLVDDETEKYLDEDPVAEQIDCLLDLFKNNFREKYADLCDQITPGILKDMNDLHGEIYSDTAKIEITNDSVSQYLIMRMKRMHLSGLYRLFGVEAKPETIHGRMQSLFTSLR